MRAYLITAAIVAASIVGRMALADEAGVAFPSDYASKFTNYLSSDRVQNPDQIIRLFANDVAMSGAMQGKALPDGSVLVGEIYAAKKDADGKVIVSSLGRRVSDKLVAVAVMEKRKGWGQRFPEELRNGDWDFAIFNPKGEKLDKDLNACRSCHAPLTSTDHLFSIEHIGR